MYNILSYGAVGDGIRLNTKEIQDAINNCSAAGGGTVLIPAGIFKTGTIWLKSNVELHLEIGATLLASDSLDDYAPEDAYPQNWSPTQEKWRGRHLIIAHEIENVAITGLGKIDGNCLAYVTQYMPENGPYYVWSNGLTKVKDLQQLRPGQMICFIECRHITVSGVTLQNAPCWSCFFHGCEFVSVYGLKINNPIDMLNSDGIDIDTSRMVTVSDCIISTGDDAIAIRCDEDKLKNKDIHCEYVTVSNCYFDSSACGVRVGVGDGIIRHVRINNIVAKRAGFLVTIQSSYQGIGCAKIEDVNFSNMSASHADRALTLETGNGAFIKNITFDNLRANVFAMSSLICDEDGLMENITLRNIELYASDKYNDMAEDKLAERGNYILKLYGVKKAGLENVQIRNAFMHCEEPLKIEHCQQIFTRQVELS